MGDPKLEKLVIMVQTMVKQFGNPMTVISFNYVWLYQLINALEVIKITKAMHGVIDFTSALMNELKRRTIDGMYILVKSFFKIMLLIFDKIIPSKKTHQTDGNKVTRLKGSFVKLTKVGPIFAKSRNLLNPNWHEGRPFSLLFFFRLDFVS